MAFVRGWNYIIILFEGDGLLSYLQSASQRQRIGNHMEIKKNINIIHRETCIYFIMIN